MRTHIQLIERPLFTALMALIQAFILYFIYVSVEQNYAFAQYPEFINSLAGFALAFPLILLFIRRKADPKRAIGFSLLAAMIIALCGYYVGIQSKPIDKIMSSHIVSVFIVCALIIAFKTVIYAQLYIAKQAFSFANLYQNSWRTFVVGLEAWIFTWLLFGILFLGAALFKIIGVDVFTTLLAEAYFTIPIFTLSFSFAVSYFQRSEKVADTVALVLQTIIKFVLPLIAIILIGFALSMIFTGVGSLWDDGPGSLLILWLQVLALFFVNTVYMGTQKAPPYAPWLHKLILSGIAFLPIYSILATYGLWLRIEQYGLTPPRGFGMLVNLLVTAFSFSYFVAIIKARSDWFLIKNKINVALGLALVIVCILLNTPLMSMQIWATKSQMARLDLSEPVADNDLRFFRNELGASGYWALRNIKAQMLAIDISYEKRLNDIYTPIRSGASNYVETDPVETEESSLNKRAFKTMPTGVEVPTVIIEATFNEDYRGQGAVFIKLDINADGVDEYLAIIDLRYRTNEYIWILEEGIWSSISANLSSPKGSIEIDQFFVDPSSLRIELEKPSFNHIRIGNSVIYVNPSP